MAAGTLAAALPGSAQTIGATNSGFFTAAPRSGVSGVVRDRTGAPQIGVLVELLDPRYNVIARTFTDDRGRYILPRLHAGIYQVKASDALFLPTVRPNLHLLSGSRAVVNLTMSTIYQALEWLPATPRAAGSSNQDWDWTLRLSANRPLLRMFDPGTGHQTGTASAASDGMVMVESGDESANAGVNHQIVFASGPRSFGQGGVSLQFASTAGRGEERPLLFGMQTAEDADGLGRIGTTAAYRQQLTPGRTVLTMVNLTSRPQIGGRIDGQDGSGLITLHVRSATTVQLGPAATVSAGTELVAARFGSGNTAMGGHPFASVAVRAGAATLSYQVATAPTMTTADAMEAQAQADTPDVVEQDGRLYLEQGFHQQVTISHAGSHWTEEAAFFEDSMEHPVVQGAYEGSEATVDSSDVLYDPGTGTIAVSGAGYRHGGGVMAMLHDQLDAHTWLTLQYALGEAVSLPGAGPGGASLTAFASPLSQPSVLGTSSGTALGTSMTAGHTSMAAVAIGGRIPWTGTLVRAGYRWQPVSTLTQVAPFDSSVPEAYLSFALRQPLHLERLGHGHVDAIVDVRNLLAQGYRPFLSKDGTMVYFAQEQRCVAAGLAFSF